MSTATRRFMALALTALLLGPVACTAEPERAGPAVYQPPPRLDDGWPVGPAERADLDTAALVRLTQDILDGRYPNTHALLIEYDGRLIYEEYFAGSDERWGDPLGRVVFRRDTLHDLRSVTKSVTTLLLGIALDGDYETALDTRLPAYFPDLAASFAPGVETVTLRHALTMTAGLEWNEMEVPYTDRDNDEIRMAYTRDPVAMVLARPQREPAGSRWYYSGGLTQVLAGLIERRTGRTIDAFAEEVLFRPLGISDYEWIGSRAWDTSPSAASGLRLRPRDLAKIGSVMLHGGRWQDRQVVPARWVALCSKRWVERIPWFPDGTYGYGFMWYPGQIEGETPQPILRAAGNGDQRLFILPETKLVVTHLAGNYNNRGVRNSEEILVRILAARKAGGP